MVVSSNPIKVLQIILSYETGDIDFDIGLHGYKFNKSIGIFGEGRYLKYWNRCL